MQADIISTDGGLGTIVTCKGKITESAYLDFYTKHLTQNEFQLHKFKYSLTDYTGLTEVNVSSKAIKEVAALTREAIEADPGCVTAIVANEDLIFGMVRMWEIQATDSDSLIMVFRKREEAEEWIRHKVLTLYGIKDLTFK